MAGVNKVILVGHLGADPEARTFSNGNKVVNLRVATSESWKDRDGNRQERTEWHTVAIFNEHLGTVAENYLRKGSKCYLEGQLQTRKWQDQSGADRYSTEIVLQKFNGALVLLDAKGEGGGQRDSGAAFDKQAARNAHGFDRDAGGQKAATDADLYGGARGGGAFDTDLDDDVPF